MHNFNQNSYKQNSRGKKRVGGADRQQVSPVMFKETFASTKETRCR